MLYMIDRAFLNDSVWLDQLRIGGRLLIPLTVALPPDLRPGWFGEGMDVGRSADPTGTNDSGSHRPAVQARQRGREADSPGVLPARNLGAHRSLA